MKNEVNNMYLAAALLSYGGKLERIDRTDIGKQKFVFKDDDFVVWSIADGGEITRKQVKLEEVIVLFLSKSLCYPPNYPSSIREVKSIIHQEQ